MQMAPNGQGVVISFWAWYHNGRGYERWIANTLIPEKYFHLSKNSLRNFTINRMLINEDER